MARYTAGSGNHWGVWFEDSVSEDGYGYTVSFTAGMYADQYWSFDTNYNIISWSSSTGDGGSATRSVNFGPGGSVQLISGSFHLSKTHSYQQPTLTVKLDRTGAGFMPGTATASNAYAVSARESHTYSFNANGGSGAPSSITKWYGEQLAVPSTKPTRTNYSFLGWAKSKTATTPDYSAGSSYWTPDEDTTLYAVWHLDYVAPKITAMTALRAGDTKGTAAPLGTYGYISCTFAKGTNSVTKVTVSDTLKKTWAVSGTTSGASGTFTAYAALAATEETDVTVSVTDGSGTTSQTRHIGTSTPPIDVGLKGTAVGILASATKAGLTLPGTRYCLGHQELPVLYYTSKPDEGSVPCKPCLVVVKGGATYLYE